PSPRLSALGGRLMVMLRIRREDALPAPRLSGRNGYSLFVSSMKLLLPCLAAALVILVVAWPQIRQHESLVGRQLIEDARREAQNLRMVNARYTGVDEKNQPF